MLGVLYLLARKALPETLQLRGAYAFVVAAGFVIVGGVGLYSGIAGLSARLWLSTSRLLKNSVGLGNEASIVAVVDEHSPHGAAGRAQGGLSSPASRIGVVKASL